MTQQCQPPNSEFRWKLLENLSNLPVHGETKLLEECLSYSVKLFIFLESSYNLQKILAKRYRMFTCSKKTIETLEKMVTHAS